MPEKLKKKLVIPILIMFIMQIIVFQPIAVYAGTQTYLADDMYIGWANGVVYPDLTSNPIYDSLGNIVSYVGSAASFGCNEEGAALKFNLSSVHGNITSAKLNINVSEVNGNPILKLLKIGDDTWNTSTAYNPPYSTADIINGYSNYSITSTGLKSFDVTTYMQTEQGNDNIASIALTGLNNNGDNDFAFICDPNSPNRPMLQITYDPYNVAFDSQGGSPVTSQTADYNTAISAPTDPNKTGYTFGGWYKEAACTNVWNFTTDKVTANTTLYAKWTINQYGVTFDSQGGSPVAPITTNYNTAISAPTDPNKTGHTFGGWYKEAACTNAWNFATDKVTANTTLYAKWTINNYTVTFDSQGGSPVAPITTNYNTTISAPTDPNKTGYSFGGWYKEAACTNAWDFASDKVTANTTLYAKWAINQYGVTFDSQGGSPVAAITANYNTTISAPTDPNKTGYTFGGWYKEAACTNAWNFTTDKVTGNTTLYAKWTINQYGVTFDSQGGSPVAPITTNYNTTISAPTNPSRTDYNFGGWYKEAACTNAWDFAADAVTGDTTLYAKWTIKEDINKDGIIDILDLAEIAKRYNSQNGQDCWDAYYDLNNDGIVDIYDMVYVSKLIT